jgi:E3 ubiquitin-protein ligase RNF14
MQFDDVRMQFAPEGARNDLVMCPTCRRRTIKEGRNNHCLCWACKTHFCCACGMKVGKMSEHYGARGCKQHS